MGTFGTTKVAPKVPKKGKGKKKKKQPETFEPCEDPDELYCGLTKDQAIMAGGATTALVGGGLLYRHMSRSWRDKLAAQDAALKAAREQAYNARTDAERARAERNRVSAQATRDRIERDARDARNAAAVKAQYAIDPNRGSWGGDLFVALLAWIGIIGAACFCMKAKEATGDEGTSCTCKMVQKWFLRLGMGMLLAGVSWWFVVKHYNPDGLKWSNLRAERNTWTNVITDWNNKSKPSNALAPVDLALNVRNNMVNSWSGAFEKAPKISSKTRVEVAGTRSRTFVGRGQGP